MVPWNRYDMDREKLIKALLAFGLPLILCAGWYIWLQIQIERQQIRNNILQQEIIRIDKPIAEIRDLEKWKQKLLELYRIYEAIQKDSERGFIELIPDLSGLVPDGVALQSVSYHADDGSGSQELLLEGEATSRGRVQALIEAVTAYAPAETPEVEYLQDNSSPTVIRFSMNLRIKAAGKPMEEDGT